MIEVVKKIPAGHGIGMNLGRNNDSLSGYVSVEEINGDAVVPGKKRKVLYVGIKKAHLLDKCAKHGGHTPMHAMKAIRNMKRNAGDRDVKAQMKEVLDGLPDLLSLPWE